VALADPNALSGAEAAEVVSLCCAAKRACDAGMALFADRVEESGAYADTGHRSAADWLGELAGESPGKAKGRLEAAKRLHELPELEAAVRRSEVSGDQAQVIADAAVLDPSAVPSLLGATTGSFGDLRNEAAKVKRAALSEEDHERRVARVHAERHVRSWIEPTGGVRGTFFFPDAAWGRCLDPVERLTEELFQAGRASGNHESRDCYRADAFIALLSQAKGAETTTPGPRAMVHLRVDVESLRRGAIEGDEVCEVAGVGPVPVRVARAVLSDCVFDVLVRKGCDLVNLTGKGHFIPTRLRQAVYERDRHCQWPGCSSTVGLEIHHWRCDVQFGGKTVLSDLRLFCGLHHDKFSHGGWRAEVDDSGTVKVIPPPEAVPLAELERRRRQIKQKAAEKRRATQSADGRRSITPQLIPQAEVRVPSRT
jgi:hypothetical protein